MHPYNILHIYFDELQEPYQTVIKQLMNGLSAQGHFVRCLTNKKVSEDMRFAVLDPVIDEKWQRELKNKQIDPASNNIYSPEVLQILQHPWYAEADRIHLHTAGQSMISPLLFPFLTGKSVIWTIYESMPNFSETELLLAQQIYQTTDFTPVVAWPHLLNEARILFGQDREIQVIQPGVDPFVFSHRESLKCRQILGIKNDAKILFLQAKGIASTTVISLLEQLSKKVPELFVVVLGLETAIRSDNLPFKGRLIDFYPSEELLALYYQTADVVCSNAEDLVALQATASGIPIWNYKFSDTITTTVEALQQLLTRNILINKMDSIIEVSNIKAMTEQYLDLYQLSQLPAKSKDVSQSVKRGGSLQEMSKERTEVHDKNALLAALNQKYAVDKMIKDVAQDSWESIWGIFSERYGDYKEANETERGIYTDLVCTAALQSAIKAEDYALLFETASKWMVHRKLPMKCGHLEGDEKLAALTFCQTLRKALRLLLEKTQFDEIGKFTNAQATHFLMLWRIVFLNSTSVLSLQEEQDEWWLTYVQKTQRKAVTPYQLMIASMYEESFSWKAEVNFTILLKAPLPEVVKIILCFWLITIPHLNATKEQRNYMIRNVSEFCQAALNLPEVIRPGFFNTSVEHLSQHFWRAAYAGGNNMVALSLFGDYITTNMKKQAPKYSYLKHEQKRKKKRNHKRIRIGYISYHFNSHAVAYYMVNRFIHHNHDQFEIFTFALGDRRDHTTEIIEKNSDHFIRKEDLAEGETIADRIVHSDLDILIYADIGMDPETYKLAALQLVPVQCVLVGHGTTTGLSTIQYYISGDFEAPTAENQYREHLVRLPNLGAAQYPPRKPEEEYTRGQFALPEDAVVFVSCANGLKHNPERDKVLIEILRQAPNAHILLKPFMDWGGVDHRFTHRIEEALQKSGIDSKRLVVYSPLPKTGDLLGLLSVCDVQLDTYPYGGWTTNMEALYMGLPIVTQEGELARSRWGSHMLKSMGISEGIARNEAEYVEWAVRFAQDDCLRQSVSRVIKERVLDVLFNGQKAQKAYEDVLIKIYNRHYR